MKWGRVPNGNRGGMAMAAGARATGLALACGLALAPVGGCRAVRPHDPAALEARATPTAPVVAAAYTTSCPDVLEVTVTGRPELSGASAVGADGAIGLGNLGRLTVEGLTPSEAALRVAGAAAVPPGQVRVSLAEYNSRQVFLFGPVAGRERAVPYQGPETVVELLRRTGGLAPEAALNEVQVVRPNVAIGRRPEVFPVDLKAILSHNYARTDVVVRPNDQVYVGATRRSILAKYLPPWEWWR